MGEDVIDSQLPIIRQQLIEHLRKLLKEKKKEGLRYSDLTRLTGLANCTLHYFINDEKYFSVSMPAIFRALKSLNQKLKIEMIEGTTKL